MKLTNGFSPEEISEKNLAASQNDRNSGQEYLPSKVVSFVKDNTDYVDAVLDEACIAIKAMA